MNNNEKGRQAEIEFRTILEERGYETYLVPKSNRWTKEKDIWGCFDIIATSPGEMLGVQVKCNSTQGCVKVLKDWKYHPYTFKKLVAIKYDNGNWREIPI